MPDIEDLLKSVRTFLDTYKIMTAPERAVFESHIEKTISESDEKTTILFQTLKQAAKDALPPDEAVAKMQAAVARFKEKPAE
jgi:hypothetical protein